ncbi:MAG TPA: metalloregulator ArsR/SmtB family transcription factor [Paraburkholderia sp.]|uniref:ArsR/SmtB family transcription factor n=1 Tax=Paraburkholderia sp. TaxID=1926495 RepID=UPI002B459B6B|nr:metalloregulator ArsR/SmtB family transcription factor [Paraburkholderia sp.]HKR45328.1 metalloregulator ArsR/SmtB family transcription factor [Paraburkholderia sp.]
MEADHLSVTFAALADPTRRAILARLAQGEATVGDLAGPFELSAPAISKHLRVLSKAGLITQGRDRQFRPCRIAPAPLKQAADWALQYRALWEQRLDQLDSYLQQLQQKPATDPPGKAAPKTTSNVSSTRTRKTRRHD